MRGLSRYSRAILARSRTTVSALALAVSACADKAAPNTANFSRGVSQYLEAKGDFCLGKTAWPVLVTKRELELRSRDAVQMPELERLGLVTSSEVTVTMESEGIVTRSEARRYELTDRGRLDFKARPVSAIGTPPNADAGRDLCAAKLTLDKVTGFRSLDERDPIRHVEVRYTYAARSTAWAVDPGVQRVFPMLARIVNGAHTLELVEAFTLTKDGWVADDLLGAPAATTGALPQTAENP